MVNGNSVFIQNRELNDARIYRELDVEPKSYYKVSFMLKSAKVGQEGIGANISAIDCLETFVIDDTDDMWENEEIYIETSSKQDKIKLSLGVGGYNEVSKGYAYFDELQVEKVNEIPENVPYLMFTDAYDRDDNGNDFVKKYSKLIKFKRTKVYI